MARIFRIRRKWPIVLLGVVTNVVVEREHDDSAIDDEVSDEAAAIASNVDTAQPLPSTALVFGIRHWRTATTWTSRHGAFDITFDDNGEVSSKRHGDVRIVPLWERARRWWNSK